MSATRTGTSGPRRARRERTLTRLLNASSLMPMLSIGSSSAMPSGKRFLTSPRAFMAVWRPSSGRRSLGMKMRMCDRLESVDRRTGTTSGSPFSPGGHGRTVVAPWRWSLETTDPAAQLRSTSTM